MLQDKRKRGVSEMVSYTLLIIIAIGLSTLVFVYLQYYVPKDRVICEKDVNLILKDYKCDGTKLNITLYNNGLFTADAAYLRFGNASRKVLPLLNDDNVYLLNSTAGIGGLPPGDTFSKSYELDKSLLGSGSNPNFFETPREYVLEIQPAIFGEKNRIALCVNSIVREKIICQSSS